MIINPYAFAGGSPFSPPDIAGLKLWLKADALSLNDGDQVSTWADSSGQGNDVTQATSGKQPIFKTAIIGGKPTVRFDGSNDTLINTTGPSISQPYTLFTTGRWAGTDFQAAFTDGGAGLQCHCPYIDSSNRPALFFGSALATSPNSLSANTPYLWSGIGNGASSILYQNGADTTASGNPGTNSLIGFCLASNEPAGGTEYLACDISEIIVYDSSLSTGNRQAVEDYIGTKYSITITH